MKKKEDRLATLKSNLLKRKKTILETAQKELHNIVGCTKERQADEVDEAVTLHQDHITTSMLTTQQLVLKKIDDAIAKIDSNTYGICEECEEEIPEGRLRVLPFATMCVSCQEEKEQREKALCLGTTEIYAE